jgi:hypothetical protein
LNVVMKKWPTFSAMPTKRPNFSRDSEGKVESSSLYGWFRLFEDRCRNCVGLGTDYYLFLQSNHRVPKDPRNYFTGSHRVTLDNGILLPFSHCSRLKLERGTRQLVYHYPLYPYIWLLVLVSEMPPVKQYILIKAACTRLQRCVRASSSSIAWSSKG